MDYLQDSENGTIVDVLRADLDISRRIEDVRCNSGDDAKRDQALVQLLTECAQRTVGLRRAMAGQHA